MGPVMRRHARPGDPRTTVRCHPARGVGATHPAAADHCPRGAPRPPVGRGGKGMATGGPGATSGVGLGRVLAHQSAHPRPHRPPHRQRAPNHGNTHMGTRRGHHPVALPGGRGRPAHRGALQNWGASVRQRPSRLGDILGPLLLMLPTDLAAVLRQELDGCDGLRVGWEAVAVGNLLALSHRDAADECQWGTLVPHLTGRHMYMATPPRGHPRLAWDDLIAVPTIAGFSPTRCCRRSGRRRSAGGTGAASAPACWSSGTPSARGGTTSGSAVSAPGRRPPTSHTPASSAGNVTRYPLQRRRAATGARSAPRWPRAPVPNLPRARTGAQ